LGKEEWIMTSLMARMFNWEASRPKYKAQEIVDRFHLNEGDAVADVGSGGGYFTFLFSGEVGESGTVFAVDVSRGNLEYIRSQAERRGLGNVKTVLAGENPMDLPEGGIDKMFLRNVFHHIKDPGSYFSGIRRFLKPDAKIVIIDHEKKTKGIFVGILKHYTPVENIVDTLAESGFQLCDRSGFLPTQSFLVFELSGQET
jgi:arsenite methyltransferase